MTILVPEAKIGDVNITLKSGRVILTDVFKVFEDYSVTLADGRKLYIGTVVEANNELISINSIKLIEAAVHRVEKSVLFTNKTKLKKKQLAGDDVGQDLS